MSKSKFDRFFTRILDMLQVVIPMTGLYIIFYRNKQNKPSGKIIVRHNRHIKLQVYKHIKQMQLLEGFDANWIK